MVLSATPFAEPMIARPRAAPVAAAVVLAAGCAIVGLVDPSGGPPVCPFKLATGVDCPGCGGTRAVHQLLRGHLLRALDYNLLAVVAFPLILWGVFASLTRILGGRPVRTWSPGPTWTAIGVVVLVAFWVLRNLPATPFHWLASGA